ncbi:MAG: raqprd family integrative conjugative element protein [Candidatus Accumulibacter sp.]|nr:raqprd family integrative conjugative element protein [Accumulibacter sp.]
MARYAYAGALLAALGLFPVFAFADDGQEPERLAALVRQLDLIDRLAGQAARVTAGKDTRYRFDYPRLREDVDRVRAGLRDYLVPPRAQPRDPAPLSGDYTRKTFPAGREKP